MGNRTYSRTALVREGYHGRCTAVTVDRSGNVSTTQYPGHNPGGNLHVYGPNGTVEQVWVSARLRGQPDACVAVTVGYDFPRWLADDLGGSLVPEADWDRALEGLMRHAARRVEAYRPVAESLARMDAEERAWWRREQEESERWGGDLDGYASAG